MTQSTRDGGLSDLTSLHAQVMAHRLALELLWANVLRTHDDPAGACSRIAEQGHQAIDACYERVGRVSEAEHIFVQAMLTHHENLWKSIETQVRALA
ncbi:hypothetical protein [Sphingomonas quercus]|uniref:Uncharacterized protein n=1 Tax=Sphingomonas quercus TaxID=2842451 RepID=A0ABS6BJU9_9SPHN|nr:hypothetical protein [Sphingomonas quercus]MBU3077529.1 hypothetical protein [Sphingomonas quercus]